jgi:hypothetical protein
MKVTHYFFAIFSFILISSVHASAVRVSTGQSQINQPYITDIINIQLNNADGLLFMAAGYRTGFTKKFNYQTSDFYTTGQIDTIPTIIYNDDIIITGDFLGSGEAQIMAANPNGLYRLLTPRIGSNAYDTDYAVAFSRPDGDIDTSDRLFSGDFTGNGKDEVLLIKSDGNYHTMQYNRMPGTTINDGNFDILESGSSPIYWWGISSDDHYNIGDYNGDGKDDLMGINPNGWMHIMTFSNGHWEYYSGVRNGDIGLSTIDADNQYVTGDFDDDGQDELFVMNDSSGENYLLKLVNGLWQSVGSSNGQIGNGSSTWTIDEDDKIFAGKFINPYLSSINNKDMLLILNTTTSLYSIYYFE